MEKEYNCKIYYPLKGLLYYLIIFSLLFAILFFISRLLDNAYIGTVGFVLLLTVPFFYQQKVKNIFTKEGTLIFNDKGLLIMSSDMKTGQNFKKSFYNWKDIQSFRFKFTPSKYTVLDILSSGWRSKKFIFFDDKNEDQSIREESVFSIFRDFVIRYNKNEDNLQKIIVSPGFLTTPIGTCFFLLPVILVAIAIILRVKYHNTYNIGFLILGISSILPMIVSRYAQKKTYARMSPMFNESDT